MRFVLGFLITFNVYLGLNQAWAEPYRREVSFEWEEVPDAKTYEVELRQVVKEGEKAKVFTFKTKEAVWSGKLVPGKYIMTLRSRDHRGVPGDWSPPSDFAVNLDTVKIKLPTNNAEINTKEAEAFEQKFAWQPVGGAELYQFELTSEDGKTQVLEKIKTTEITQKIPVAMSYTWKVTALGKEDMQSETVAVSQFTVVGEKITAPKITPPESEFVREIKWTKPDNAEKYDVTLLKYNGQSKKFEKVSVQEDFAGDTFDFDSKLEGGTYHLQVKAKGQRRQSSEAGKATFKVKGGDRSPAAEYTALVRKSIDRVTGWYAVASYLITEINYRGETPETGGLASIRSMGGTGRLGAGFFSKNDIWGFLGIVDMSGFIMNGTNHTYSSAEVSAIYRYNVGDRGEARFNGGLFYKELPQLIGDPDTKVTQFYQSAVIGPQVGAEYWYSLTPKLGFQVNTHLYYGLITVKTHNGNKVDPRISYQLGLMGSYRFNTRFTGLMGITRRLDQVAYKANKTGNSLEEGPGEYNDTRITGDYLSFYAEYGF